MPADLFAPYDLGPIVLSNRVVMAPMTRSRATPDHVPTPIMADYYGARASGGLLITEGVAPAPEGCGYARIPGAWSAEQEAAWAPVARAVHEGGGRIFMQLMHTGRIGHPLNMPEGAALLAPSALAAPGTMYTDQQGPQPHPVPRAMTAAEVEEALDSFVQAARHAVAAGFDGVELHGANGYLIEQFLSPDSNQRGDAWGGPVTRGSLGRARFAVEAARRTAEAIGPERVGIRLSPHGVFNGISPWEGLAEEYVVLAEALGALELAYVHLVDHSAMGAPPVPRETKEAIAQAFGGTVILAGGFDRDAAEAALDDGLGQLVAFGRPYLANPDLVRRLREGAELNPPDFSTFYTPGAKGYLDYPTLDEVQAAK